MHRHSQYVLYAGSLSYLNQYGWSLFFTFSSPSSCVLSFLSVSRFGLSLCIRLDCIRSLPQHLLEHVNLFSFSFGVFMDLDSAKKTNLANVQPSWNHAWSILNNPHISRLLVHTWGPGSPGLPGVPSNPRRPWIRANSDHYNKPLHN